MNHQAHTNDQYQEKIKEIAKYRLRRLWTAAGILPLAVLYVIFLVMINTANVAEPNIRKFNYVAIGLIVAFQFIFVLPYMGKLANMTKAYPNWQKDLKEKVSLSSSEVLKYFLPGLGATLILVIAFTSFYQPNSRPKTADDYQAPTPSSVSPGPTSRDREIVSDFRSSVESSEGAQDSQPAAE